jgi:hypothetical protein
VAINNFNRTTRALIGATDATAGTPILDTNYINVTGGVQTQACLAGDVWAFTVAGSVVKEDKKPDNPTPTAEPKDPLDGASLPDPVGGGSDNKEGSKTGVGVAAAASINLITGETTSRIADAGHLRAASCRCRQRMTRAWWRHGRAGRGDEGQHKTAVRYKGLSYKTADTVAEVRHRSGLTGNAAGDFVFDVNALTRSKVFGCRRE